jgi:hypothetical protein
MNFIKKSEGKKKFTDPTKALQYMRTQLDIGAQLVPAGAWAYVENPDSLESEFMTKQEVIDRANELLEMVDEGKRRGEGEI